MPRGDFWPSMEDRLMAKLRLEGECLISDHGRDSAGYPLIYGEGRQRRVHKVWWELWFGPVPDGYELDHACVRFGKQCVAHLELVTHAENIRRGLAAKRRAREMVSV